MANPPDAELSRALETLDEVVRSVLAGAKPVEFRLASTDAERKMVYRLRYDTIVERGWLSPGDFADQQEIDEFDADAEQVLGYDGSQLAASARLVFPRPGRLLPTEAAFDVRAEPQGVFADMGRIIVLPAYTSMQHRIMAGLLAYAWGVVREHGFMRVLGTGTPGMIRLYQRLGFTITPLGPPRTFWGEERTPLHFDVLASAPVLLARWAARPNASPDS